MKFQTRLKQIKRNLPIFYNKPALLPTIVRGVLKGRFLRRPVMRYLELQVNTECNQRCECCFASKATRQDQKQLSLEEIHEIWEELKKIGIFQGIITGGEPTLRKDLFQIFEILETNKYMFGITTNSILLDRDYVKELKKTGISYLALSLNSLNVEENDQQRGTPGHFEKVMQAIEWAKEFKLPVGLSTILSHQNFREFERMAQFCQEANIQICPAFAVSQGRWARNDGVRLTPEDYKKLTKLNEKYSSIRSELSTNLCLKTTCPGGTEKLFITAYGDITTCQLNPVSFGNVRLDSINKSIERMRRIESFSRINPICVVSSDQEYITKYIDPISESDYRPVPIFESYER